MRSRQERLQTQPHEDHRLAYKTYNAYSRFIHHLYEFVLGAVAREQGTTAKIEGANAERGTVGRKVVQS
jgi:hypothetical protein